MIRLGYKLNAKQELFCQRYATGDVSASEAYFQVYQPNNKASAGTAAHRLLKKEQIQDRIKELQTAACAKHSITRERILERYAQIAFGDPAELLDEKGRVKKLRDIPEHLRPLIAGLEVVNNSGVITHKVKLVDQKGALEALAKIMGMFDKDNSQKAARIHISAYQPRKPVPKGSLKTVGPTSPS